MRMAVSGSHGVGKTTLGEDLADRLPGFELVPEPYLLMEEEGSLFANPPSLEDFEMQLERSVFCILDSGADVVFDRCPLDILGYIAAHRDACMFRIGDWLPPIRESVGLLDLIIFVPVEVPDRIDAPCGDPGLREEIDAILREIIVDDAYGLGFDVITVSGPFEGRVRQVLGHLG